MTALDTGFFLRLLEGHEEAGALWRALAEGEGEGVGALAHKSVAGAHAHTGRIPFGTTQRPQLVHAFTPHTAHSFKGKIDERSALPH